MSKFEDRVGVGIMCGAFGGFIFGPFGAYVGWKIGGALVTGNLLYLVPFGAPISDTALGFSELAGLSDISDAATAQTTDLNSAVELADSGPNIQGNQGNVDIWQRPPLDGQGNPAGRLGNGELPKDIWGRTA